MPQDGGLPVVLLSLVILSVCFLEDTKHANRDKVKDKAVKTSQICGQEKNNFYLFILPQSYRYARYLSLFYMGIIKLWEL